MKKLIILFLCSFSLFSCSQNGHELSESDISGSSFTVYNEPETECTETLPNETSSENPLNTDFIGLSENEENVIIGNSISSLNCNGIMCIRDSDKYYEKNGNLYKNEEMILSDVLPTSINVLDDMIYFINGNDNRAYSYNEITGEYSCFIESEISMLIITDKYYLYEDTTNSLYICKNDEVSLISKNIVTWVDIYGQYIISCEFGNGCSVNSYDINNASIVQILDYGFFPAVHEGDLFYQEKNKGYIEKISLTTGEKTIVMEDWGQCFSFISNELFYINSKGLYSVERGGIYTPENNFHIDYIFSCDNKLFLTEKASDSDSTILYELDIENGERTEIK